MSVDGYGLGRLQPVDPRDYWRHEAHHFTPWLLANADVLGQALGMDLALTAAEHAVGGFSLDLIGTDKKSGETVIVENQLEQSDHMHLGQILTYAGGTDPADVVWVAPSFRDEHRAALEWLNGRTNEQTRFFAVVLSLVRIGDSAPAPLFSVVVEPNDWSKQVRATVSPSGNRWTEEDFWPALAERAPDLEPAIRALVEHTRLMNGQPTFYWGVGAIPALTPQFTTEAGTTQPWSLYWDSAGTTLYFAVNFDWIYKQGRAVPGERVDRLADRLRALPNLQDRIEQARSNGWRRRPPVVAGTVLRPESNLRAIIAAFDELYAHDQPEQLPSAQDVPVDLRLGPLDG